MASTLKGKYGAANVAITVTFTSLTSGSLRQSAVVDNSANLYLDALVTVKAKSNAAGTSTSGYLIIYAYGTTNTGTDYDGGASGSDAGYTKDVTPPNLQVIGVITLNANATTVRKTMSVAAAFGGQLPDHWGIVIENQTNATLDASVGTAWYQGIQAQSV